MDKIIYDKNDIQIFRKEIVENGANFVRLYCNLECGRYRQYDRVIYPGEDTEAEDKIALNILLHHINDLLSINLHKQPQYFTIHSLDLCTTDLVQKPNTGTCYVHQLHSNRSIPVELEAEIKKAIEKIVNDYYGSKLIS